MSNYQPFPIGRLAPYPVWTAMRVLWLVALALIPGSVVWLFYGGSSETLWTSGSFWMFMAGVMLASTGGRGSAISFKGLISPGCDAIGHLLASHQCPACGQSCFDSSPPSGYVPESATHTWWPLRHCAQCGHDLKQRLPGQPPQASR